MTPAHEIVGAGPFLVLVPGTFSDRRTWLKVVGALAGMRSCLLFDPRGTGETPDPGGPFTADDLVEDLVAVMDAAGVERADLLGHSLGAGVSLLLAARHPGRVRRVVAVGPALYPDPFLLSVFEQWAALAASDLPDEVVNKALVLLSFGRAAHERLVPAVLTDMSRRPLARETILRYVECDRDLDLRPFLGRVDARALVVCGEEDALTGAAQARAVAETLPDGRLELIPGCGHSPQVERPAELARLAATFLRD
jgi:pimeloyl-ACP methyl ester carboxylesterase